MIAWRAIQRQNFIHFKDLADFLELSSESREACLEKSNFRINLPRRLAEKIKKNDLTDPLFLQFVPLKKELEKKEGFVADPVCDANYKLSDKILKKYEGRALLVTTSACAMHCRYCFRQNFEYATARQEIKKELSILRKDPTIEEVILSGGDPLSLSDEELGSYLLGLDAIPHIQRIRFHTRFPIGIPERINESFLALLKSIKKKIYFTVHINHPKELDHDVIYALNQVARLGIPLLNQSVLLKGINDTPETMLALCKSLIDAGIIPYYLHLLDPVEGASHFAVSIDEGKALIEHIQNHLSGYGVPRLAAEIPGKKSKTTDFQSINKYQF